MLNIQSLVLCVVLSIAVSFFLRHRRISELAEGIARDFCRSHQVVFLDDTVQCTKMRWKKNDVGRWRFYRLYLFEYSSDEVERGHGAMAFVTDQLQQIQFVEPAPLNP